MEQIVIIGGVAAGATAAAKVRRLSADAKIIMLEAGPDISFANCGLPYYIGGDIKSRSKLILQSPESFKEQYDVDVYINTKVVSIDKENKTIVAINVLSGEQTTIAYTKLILAQGGKPIMPDLPGANMSHVFSLWTLDDMDKIYNHMEKTAPKTAVVVGGGFIGLEMVEALVKRGIKVSVVEMMPHVMSIMEPEIAGNIQKEMLAYNVDIHTGIGVTAISQNAVQLNNGKELGADMVILSIGVRPTLQLAVEAGLELGEAGGLLVNSQLRTSDANIYGAGDMIEIEHRVLGKKVRIPLAGPANRQGRIAAENALGGNHEYKGAIGTSIVRVFDAVAGITGLSLKQALKSGFDAEAVVVHKEHHTSYFPGAETVTVMIVYDKKTGIILGGQTAGYKGADKRLDVIATAAASKLTISDLADIDYSYSPPIGTANDAINMAAYVAENRITGYSPSVTTSEIDNFVLTQNPVIIDVRDIFAYEKGHIKGAIHIALELLKKQTGEIPTNRAILVYDENGKKGHQALRTLKGMGFDNVTNISGGYISVQYHERGIGFKNIEVKLSEVPQKNIQDHSSSEKTAEEVATKKADDNKPVIIDVRSKGEFATGAYPNAINIPVDEIAHRITEIGTDKSREITLYCASGARSAYAQQILTQLGYTKTINGGGISAMMSKLKNSTNAETQQIAIIIDVRSPQEFAGGAFPGAKNIPLDELPRRVGELGGKNREITLYCASGARSAYGQNVLKQLGFTNTKNGGGIMQMMANR